MNTQTKTLSVKVRQKHYNFLNQLAFDANQVWNAVNAFTDDNCFIPVPSAGWIAVNYSAFDLQKMFKFIRKERGLNIGSSTFQEVVAVHAKSRKQFKKNKLKFRCSGGARRALGWVPFKAGAVVWKKDRVRFCGKLIRIFDSYELGKYKFRSGNFSQDTTGDWYLNIIIHVPVKPAKSNKAVGIDLGLKTIATCSDGTQLKNARIYRGMEPKLAKAQRARKKKQIKRIHRKIKRKRKDAIHKFSRGIANEYKTIIVGNVSSSGLVKTKMAKSVLDAGWSMLKTQLEYKAIGLSGEFKEVNEAYSTQVCSCCGCISDNSPKGRADLNRENGNAASVALDTTVI